MIRAKGEQLGSEQSDEQRVVKVWAREEGDAYSWGHKHQLADGKYFRQPEWGSRKQSSFNLGVLGNSASGGGGCNCDDCDIGVACSGRKNGIGLVVVEVVVVMKVVLQRVGGMMHGDRSGEGKVGSLVVMEVRWMVVGSIVVKVEITVEG
ncbi:hypothetical protein Pcinc_024522 [Petrolisthes cinctipes]|uniref:Uncharacterized protein n=1 Tax=Petrolisthes cinctipes TaxID=88211 RepID=A0AAE1FCG9_PETCI|nr:hypothetical protein Pcinc_024522 [Petrolisthes cinctipes]